jgi:hypothetical protein
MSAYSIIGMAGRAVKRETAIAPEDDHLLTVLRHVERNPVRVGLVGRVRDWLWSSLAAAPGVSLHGGSVGRHRDWIEWVNRPDHGWRAGEPVDLRRPRPAVRGRRLGGGDGGPIGVGIEPPPARPAAVGGPGNEYPELVSDGVKTMNVRFSLLSPFLLWFTRRGGRRRGS